MVLMLVSYPTREDAGLLDQVRFSMVRCVRCVYYLCTSYCGKPVLDVIGPERHFRIP